MGAGASVQGDAPVGEDVLSSTLMASPRAAPMTADPSSPKGKYAVPLEVLMDARWCAHLKEYITSALKADLQLDMDEGSATSMAELSSFYLQFWLDVSDFSLLSESPFRNMRGEDICERYLVHGAKSQIPLSRLIVEDIMMKKDAEGGAPRDIFVVAQDEAFEFLEAEIFPLFLKNDGPKGYRHVNKIIKTANRLHKMAVQESNGVTDTLTVLRQELRETLEGGPSAKALLDYMMRKRDYPELVLFYLEILDFKEIMTGFLRDQQNAPAGKTTHSFRYFLMRANKIYDKYLKLGSSLRSIFPEQDIRDVVSKVSTASNMSPQAFDALHNSALELLLHDYFADFKDSQEYRKMVPEARSGDVDRRSSVACQSPPATEEDRKALAEMLAAARVRQFKSYLTANGNGNYLLFYYEVEDFKNIPSSQAAFVQGRAHKIFDKYIKRGAPLELMLDPILRAEIVKSIDEATVDIYNWAQHTCFEILLEQFPSFKMSDLFQDMLREKEMATPSLDMSGITGGRSDVALEDVLSNSSACAMFKKFAESEFCVEPLLFWLEVEEYKRLPRSEFLNQRARKIINRYIKDGAQCYITITPEARAQVIERSTTTGPTTFQPAQAEVHTFLEGVLLPKYRKTEDFSGLMQVLNEGRNNSGSRDSVVDLGAAYAASLTGGASPSGAIPGGPLALTIKPPLCDRLQPNCDVTLREVLQHPAGVKFFKDFLIIRLCAENLLFWLEVEDFKNIPGLDFMKIHARKISVKYITEDAKQQVNIDHSMRTALLAELKVNPHRFVFQKAQDEIYKVMNRDCFNQFLASDQCKRFRELLIQEIAEEQQSWGGFLKAGTSARTSGGAKTPPNKRPSLAAKA